MKIHIELDVSPDEIPLATELITVLRRLAEHVTVKQQSTNGSSALVSPQNAFSSPRGAPTPPNTHPSEIMPVPGSVSPAALPVPSVPLPVLSTANQLDQIRSLLAAAEYAEQPDQVAQQLEALASRQTAGDAIFTQFIEIWKEIALSPILAAENRSAVPFCIIFTHVSPTFKEDVKNQLIPFLLRHLTAKRSVDAPRSDFFQHAEAFSAMVSIGAVPVKGAVTTISKLLLDPEKRAAAVTMLGKTVELCAFLLQQPDSVPPEVLNNLRDKLATITDEQFMYDVSYIQEAMGWTTSTAMAVNGSSLAAALPQGIEQYQNILTPVASFSSHSETIFSIAYDARGGQLVTGGRDNFVQVWSQEGEAVQKLDLQQNYITNMDYHEDLDLLLAVGLGTQQASFFLSGFAPNQQRRGFTLQGFLNRSDASSISCVKAMPGTTGFLTAESVPNPEIGGNTPVIVYWDLAQSSAGFGGLAPARKFSGHQDMVITLSKLPGDPNTFASGSKDGAILLWDIRQLSAVGALSCTQPDGTSLTTAHHPGMVTSIVPHGTTTVLSGGTDRLVKVWDLRQSNIPVSSVPVDNNIIVKIASHPHAKVAAVSAMSSLFVMDYTNEAAPVVSKVECVWPDGRTSQTYQDIKWSSTGSVLYAAGRDKVLDMFAFS